MMKPISWFDDISLEKWDSYIEYAKENWRKVTSGDKGILYNCSKNAGAEDTRRENS